MEHKRNNARSFRLSMDAYTDDVRKHGDIRQRTVKELLEGYMERKQSTKCSAKQAKRNVEYLEFVHQHPVEAIRITEESKSMRVKTQQKKRNVSTGDGLVLRIEDMEERYLALVDRVEALESQLIDKD